MPDRRTNPGAIEPPDVRLGVGDRRTQRLGRQGGRALEHTVAAVDDVGGHGERVGGESEVHPSRTACSIRANAPSSHGNSYLRHHRVDRSLDRVGGEIGQGDRTGRDGQRGPPVERAFDVRRRRCRGHEQEAPDAAVHRPALERLVVDHAERHAVAPIEQRRVGPHDMAVVRSAARRPGRACRCPTTTMSRRSSIGAAAGERRAGRTGLPVADRIEVVAGVDHRAVVDDHDEMRRRWLGSRATSKSSPVTSHPCDVAEPPRRRRRRGGPTARRAVRTPPPPSRSSG